jgi:hypothetical protein
MGLALLGAVLAVGAWRFFSPSVVHEYGLAPASDFAPGTVTSYIRGDGGLARFWVPSPDPAWGWSGTVPVPSDLVHVVRLPDGELLVLSGVSPHRRQPVLWFPTATAEVGESRGLFGDDFSWWLVDGTRMFGPAPRDLPRYRWHIDGNGVLVIDLGEPIEGEWLPGSRREAPTPYDVTSEGWATSGWPSAVEGE